MIKNFNSVPMLKSSEDCYKFSKSVSYETLAGGTPATGREYGEALEREGVITRRTLVRRGYLPEQGTHANKESLFASVTCFMRLPRRIQRMFLVMTISALALLFAIATTAESWADDTATQNEETPKILPDSGSCGNGCLYQITIDATTGARNLRVYNAPNYTGAANIAGGAFAGKGNNTVGNYEEYYANANFDKITIDGNFDTIGGYAFWRNGATEVVFNGNIKNIGYAAFEFNSLSSVNLPEGLKKIGGEAFYGSPLNSITIPDSVTEVNSWAFTSLTTDAEVYIADTLESVGINQTFGYNERLDTISIICKGDVEKCESLVSNYSRDNGKTHESLPVTGVDKDHCTGDKYFWNGTSCSRKEIYCDNNMYYTGYECKMRPTDGTDITCDYEYSGWVKVGDNCASPENSYAKKHYTPAEANQWLKDDDNFVVLTFKK